MLTYVIEYAWNQGLKKRTGSCNVAVRNFDDAYEIARWFVDDHNSDQFYAIKAIRLADVQPPVEDAAPHVIQRQYNEAVAQSQRHEDDPVDEYNFEIGPLRVGPPRPVHFWKNNLKKQNSGQSDPLAMLLLERLVEAFPIRGTKLTNRQNNLLSAADDLLALRGVANGGDA